MSVKEIKDKIGAHQAMFDSGAIAIKPHTQAKEQDKKVEKEPSQPEQGQAVEPTQAQATEVQPIQSQANGMTQEAQVKGQGNNLQSVSSQTEPVQPVQTQPQTEPVQATQPVQEPVQEPQAQATQPPKSNVSYTKDGNIVAKTTTDTGSENVKKIENSTAVNRMHADQTETSDITTTTSGNKVVANQQAKESSAKTTNNLDSIWGEKEQEAAKDYLEAFNARIDKMEKERDLAELKNSKNEKRRRLGEMITSISDAVNQLANLGFVVNGGVLQEFGKATEAIKRENDKGRAMDNKEVDEARARLYKLQDRLDQAKAEIFKERIRKYNLGNENTSTEDAASFSQEAQQQSQNQQKTSTTTTDKTETKEADKDVEISKQSIASNSDLNVAKIMSGGGSGKGQGGSDETAKVRYIGTDGKEKVIRLPIKGNNYKEYVNILNQISKEYERQATAGEAVLDKDKNIYVPKNPNNPNDKWTASYRNALQVAVPKTKTSDGKPKELTPEEKAEVARYLIGSIAVPNKETESMLDKFYSSQATGRSQVVYNRNKTEKSKDLRKQPELLD
jgi:hypothetical protein